MEVLFVLIPLALTFAGIAVLAFIWSVKNAQYDDLDTCADLVFEEVALSSREREQNLNYP